MLTARPLPPPRASCIFLLLRRRLTALLRALAGFADRWKALPTLGYTHYQPAQLVTVGKRATLWMQDLLSDLNDLDYVLGGMQFLGCRGTTGTEASFLDLFEGDTAKIDLLNRRLASAFGFDACFPVCGQTYPRKQDSRFLNSSMTASCRNPLNPARSAPPPWPISEIPCAASASAR